MTVVLAMPAAADLQEGDLLAANDGLVTFDTATELEWLDLTETIGSSWNDVESSNIASVLGFRHATRAEVETLFLNAGFLTVDNVNNPANDPAATLLITLLGCTQFCATVNETGRGFAEFDADFSTRPNYHQSGLGAGAAVVSGLSDDFGLVDLTAGNFMVRSDGDDDGVPDLVDNCLDDANSSQTDSDQDGYGNTCDSDFNNDGTVNIPDFGLLKAAFGTTSGDAGFHPACDCTDDLVIGLLDFGCLKAGFGQSPGPSGYACAGTIPCPTP